MRVVLLPHAASSASLARRKMVAELTASGVRPDLVDDAQLVLAELVGNAVRHGAPTCDDGVAVSWSVGGHSLELRVTDGGDGRPTRQAAGERAETGRGLAIVDALASAWGFEHPGGGGTSVWARVDL